MLLNSYNVTTRRFPQAMMAKHSVWKVLALLSIISTLNCAFSWGMPFGDRALGEKASREDGSIEKEGKLTESNEVHVSAEDTHKQLDSLADKPPHEDIEDNYNLSLKSLEHVSGRRNEKHGHQDAPFSKNHKHEAIASSSKLRMKDTEEHQSVRGERDHSNDDHPVSVRDNSYPAIQKEIDDFGKELGPVVPDTSSHDISSHDILSHDAPSHYDHGMHISNRGESHKQTSFIDDHSRDSLLRKGLADAIVGLTHAYNSLRTPSEVVRKESKHNEQEYPKELSDRAYLSSASSRNESLEGKVSSKGVIGNDTLSKNVTGRAAGEELDDNKDDGEGDGSGAGITALAVLASVVFIVAVGIMAVGYAQNQDSGTQNGPLYPPKGPSFV